MSTTHDPRDGHRFERRTVLAAALVGAGAVAIAPALRAAGHTATGQEHFSVIPEGSDTSADWLRLRLRRDGSGEPLRLRVTPAGESGAAITVSSTTGYTAIDGAVDGRAVEAAPSGDGSEVTLTPLRVGSPGAPDDRLVIQSADRQCEVDVWVEPEGGVWGGLSPEDPPFELGIVAIHAALMRKGDGAEVIMYSLARDRDPFDGEPVPDPAVPGQWLWDVFRMGDMEAKALDLGDYTLADRVMTPPKNVFCGGQTHLPDGRLMHVGGHFSLDDTVHDADMIHMYDAKVLDPTAAWTHIDHHMNPPRWYPSVTALPDGRILVTSGARTLPRQNPRDHEPDGYWNVINNDYLIVDPVTGTVLYPKGADPSADLIDQPTIDRINTAIAEAHSDLPGEELAEYYQQLATYPAVHVLPGANGEAIVSLIESNRAWLYRYTGDRLRRTDFMYPMRTRGSRSYPHYGAPVLLPLENGRNPRVLYVGGQHEELEKHRLLLGEEAELPATTTAEIFEVDTASATGTWHAGGRMAHPRVLCDATLLADGQVLVSGGSTWGWGDINGGPVYESELFDPAADAPAFAPAATAKTERRYHSTALLLPDGSLLKAGSTGGFGSYVNNTSDRMLVDTTAERYFPAYMFRGPRPIIHSVTPGTVDAPLTPGATFLVNAGGPALNERARVALIRPGATTHGANMDQRFVWLEAQAEPNGGTWDLRATMPTNAATAPPGAYMLVVVAENRVPTEAHWVHIAAGT
ncbi:galactose oxidase-like domain-containing protein [Stackebrandtia soli]|uniref:glyoxal oxidase n=1 Tax=Stackebrandtia soli TaxID=1892856 RepID=UPI0039EBD918